MTALLVVAGAVVGAPLRYVVDLFVQSRRGGAFPWGTVTVNALGSLVLGAVAGAVSASGAPSWLLTLVGTGFCGALTTFSTFSVETLRLAEEGSIMRSAANVAVSVGVGLLAVSSGWVVAAALVGG